MGNGGADTHSGGDVELGAEMLQSTENSIAEVAAAVGYGSEAAFKRQFDCPPAHFRRSRNAQRPGALTNAAISTGA